ncbi:MAG: L-seryl-tRNA(Sec) selenium transferase, partial [Candidatus Aminicenantes bacterium]
MTDTTPNAPFRKIPSLDSLLREDAVLGLIEEFGRDVVVAEGRAVLAKARATIAAPGTGNRAEADVSPESLVTRLRVRLEKKFAPSLSPAVNATGIVMHSGLGRAVLSKAACEALDAVAVGYSTLALDLESGKRVSRDRHVEGLLRELSGAEAATVAN